MDKQEMLRVIEAKHGLVIDGECWTTDEVTQAFEITGFMAPFCVAINRETGKKGVLSFVHQPRIYFDWQES